MSLDWIPLVWGLHHPWRFPISTALVALSLLVGWMVYEEGRITPYPAEILAHFFGVTIGTVLFIHSGQQDFSAMRVFLSITGVAAYLYRIMSPKQLFDWMLWGDINEQ